MKTKICTKCEKEKSISKFHKNRKMKDGLSCWCKSCNSKRQKEAYKKNKEIFSKRARHQHYKKKYGIIEKFYDLTLAAQGYKCAICGKSEAVMKQRFCVDHSHITGKFRGLLCSSCNKTLGFVNDSPYILQKMIDYLNERS